MSFTGYKRRTTPFLDRFNVKLRAISAAPHTYSSVPSILSGLYPHNHGAIISGSVRNFDKMNNFKQVRHNVVTLPELFRALNYDVYFLTNIYPAFLPLRNRVVPELMPLNVSAEKLLNKALDLIEGSIKSNNHFFAYIHIGDLHEPINPPENFKDFFGHVEPLCNIERWAYRKPEEQQGRCFERYKYNRVLLYDNTLRYVDHVLEHFYSKIEDRKLVDSTLLVITGDHGEEFWEHAVIEAKFFFDPRGFYGVGHGHNLFNEIIEVPILIAGSETSRINKNTNERVSTVDIIPTILEWLGVRYLVKLDGYSLLETIPKERCILSEAVSYGYEKKALIKGKHKLLYARNDKVAWVFNLEKDPFEKNPITKERIVTHLLIELKRILARDITRGTMLPKRFKLRI